MKTKDIKTKMNDVTYQEIIQVELVTSTRVDVGLVGQELEEEYQYIEEQYYLDTYVRLNKEQVKELVKTLSDFLEELEDE